MGAWYTFGFKLSQCLARAMFSFRVVHPERIIETGGVLLAMNHQSFVDPPLAGICCKREIHFLARKTLLDWPVLGPILPKLNVVPVNQERADMSALKTVIKLVKAGHCTIIFPEGGRTLDGNLQPAQPGIGLIIAKSLVPVVPMRIFGAYDAYPTGAKYPKRRPITIVVGEPLIFTEADLTSSGRELYQRLSDRVMESVAAIQYERP